MCGVSPAKSSCWGRLPARGKVLLGSATKDSVLTGAARSGLGGGAGLRQLALAAGSADEGGASTGGALSCGQACGGVRSVVPAGEVVKEMVDDAFGTIQEELVALTTGTTEEDLAAAKAQLKLNMLAQMDGTSPNAEEIGRQMLAYGRRMSLAETFARIDAIEAEDVQRVSEKVIWDQEIAFAGMGPNLKYVFDVNGLRRGTFWNRL